MTIRFDSVGRKKILLDGIKTIRAGELVGTLAAVFIFPEDIELTAGPSTHHRQFFDLYISQANKGYIDWLGSFQKALTQRNRLLKEISRDSSGQRQLEAWDELLIEEGAKIVAARKTFVDSITGISESFYKEFDNNILKISYSPKVATAESDIKSAIAKLLKLYRPRELRAGLTLVGPHRDKLEINLNGRPIRHYGSRGQKRCAMIALKLGAAEYLSQTDNGDVILILDEAFAELDQIKSRALMEILAGKRQVFMATAGMFGDMGLKAERFTISNGKISQE
ncbi:MAG: DNA replication and repair protein RecF [candidate division Zixibacteria bacterium]|nr:DNA replication and repair protein RecF [candidate division Zixibacteria bacterium]